MPEPCGSLTRSVPSRVPNVITVPATGLSTDRAYGDGLASLRLDAQNPIMFQGWMSGHAGLVPGKKYRLRVRWRTEEVEEPLHADEPYGACVKLMGWPEPGATAAVPAVIAHVHGDTPWHVAEGQFTADRDFVPNVVLLLENAARGAAYVDECALYEVRDDGTLGPQLLRTPRANAHLYYDLARGYAMDGIFEEAARRGLCFKLVVSEKQEYLLDHLAPDGLPDPLGGNFFGAEGSPSRRLHEYYWRHLMARTDVVWPH